MTSTFSRAALSTLNTSNRKSAYEDFGNSKARRVSEIAKTNFTSKYNDDDSDGDDTHTTNNVNVELWKSQDFGRSKSITANDVNLERRPSTFVRGATNMFARTKSEEQILNGVDNEEINTDVYIADSPLPNKYKESPRSFFADDVNNASMNNGTINGKEPAARLKREPSGSKFHDSILNMLDSPERPTTSCASIARPSSSSSAVISHNNSSNNIRLTSANRPKRLSMAASALSKSNMIVEHQPSEDDISMVTNLTTMNQVSPSHQHIPISSSTAGTTTTTTTIESARRYPSQPQQQSQQPQYYSTTSSSMNKNKGPDTVRRETEEDDEKEQLRKQLELIQQHNNLLQHQLTQQKQESEKQIELERQDKFNYYLKIEQEKLLLSKQLTQYQEESELALKKEKENIIRMTNKMEIEKLELNKKLMASESQYKVELDRVVSRQQTLQQQLHTQDHEKQVLHQQLLEIKRKEALSETEEIPQKNALLVEKMKLEEQIAYIEKEKKELMTSLSTSDQQYQALNQDIQQKLNQEKIAYEGYIEQMEKEKSELKNHLLLSEQETQMKMNSMMTQLQEEKDKMQQAMNQIEQENQRLQSQLTQVATTLEQNMKEGETISSKVKDKEVMIEESKRQKDILESQMKDIQLEKESLARQLQVANEASKQREQYEVDRIARERDELKALVEKMKAEHALLTENNTALNSATTVTSNGIVNGAEMNGSAKQPVSILKKRSSYVVINEERNTVQKIINALEVEEQERRNKELEESAEHDINKESSGIHNTHNDESDNLTEMADTIISHDSNLTTVMSSIKRRDDTVSVSSSKAETHRMNVTNIPFQKKPNISLHNLSHHSLSEMMEQSQVQHTAPPLSKNGIQTVQGQSSGGAFQNTTNATGGQAKRNSVMSSMNDFQSRRSSIESTLSLRLHQAYEEPESSGVGGGEKGVFSKSDKEGGGGEWDEDDITGLNSSVSLPDNDQNTIQHMIQQALQQDSNSTKKANTIAGTTTDIPPNAVQTGTTTPLDPFQDLPAPHICVAKGDLIQLQSLARLENSLLKSLDKKSRTPLFYAVAYNHSHVMEYIIQYYPELITHVDMYGDSPLHAAASANALECITYLLSIPLESNNNECISPNIQNKKGMTAAHMTNSPEILEILLSSGADFSICDNNNRSPLFVACAMNRVEAADYLISCLDLSEASLLQRDKRGDTPLHAAACNGSVDCLLLLLQHAIDPRLINDKGLKAIDLAVKNKHIKCKDMLAEYHLHYCTSSSFDSVLFFAALEGHKKAKDIQSQHIASADSRGSSDGYSIVRETEDTDVVKKVKSFFSLRHDNALRLESWGAWILFQDVINKTSYWYNQDTQMGSNDEPAEVKELKFKSSMSMSKQNMNSASFHSGKYLTKKKSMRLKRIGDWIQYITPESKQTFFYNEKTKEFQWEDPTTPIMSTKEEDITAAGDQLLQHNTEMNSRPTSAVSMKANGRQVNKIVLQKTSSVSPLMKEDSSISNNVKNETSSSTTTTATSSGEYPLSNNINESDNSVTNTNTTTAAAAAATSDWSLYEDPVSGHVFWYNAVTQISQWECPFEVPIEEHEHEHDIEGSYEDDALRINHEDELGI